MTTKTVNDAPLGAKATAASSGPVALADCLIGEKIEGTAYYAVREGDKSVAGNTRHCPTPGFQPDGLADDTWWDKVKLADGRVVWKIATT